MNRNSLPIILSAVLCGGIVAISFASCGSNGPTGPAGGPADGSADMHCIDPSTGQPITQATSQTDCQFRPPPDAALPPDAPGTTGPDAAPEFGPTMYGTVGNDDDCKYHVTWTSTPIYENDNVFFTVVATDARRQLPGHRREHLRRGLPQRHASGAADEPVRRREPARHVQGRPDPVRCARHVDRALPPVRELPGLLGRLAARSRGVLRRRSMMRGWSFSLLFVLASCTGSAPDCPRDNPTSCPADAPSYANDIAPLIEQYCSQCHNPQGSAFDQPISTYSDLDQRKVDVLDEIYACEMPMSPAPQPTLAERVTLLTWFVCGAPDN